MGIGLKIRLIRETKGLTQIELAKLIGVDNQTISNWENNKNTPRGEMMGRLAEAFGLTPEEISKDISLEKDVEEYYIYLMQIWAFLPIEKYDLAFALMAELLTLPQRKVAYNLLKKLALIKNETLLPLPTDSLDESARKIGKQFPRDPVASDKPAPASGFAEASPDKSPETLQGKSPAGSKTPLADMAQKAVGQVRHREESRQEAQRQQPRRKAGA
ncbi:MAG: helix-turn-helix transcriptional regulator [Planctomycetes bacterium]|nr:helix-turn-helix transcriptional regulator [Planctomycetota bacterium]